jgi:hypothetical protein
MADITVGVHATVIRISVDGQDVFLPRAQASEFLGEFMRAMAESVPDNYSRKVPDTPALRLVGGFHCDPDPSCGQKDGAA